MPTIPPGYMHMAASVSSTADPDPWTVTLGASLASGSTWESGFDSGEGNAVKDAWKTFFLNFIDASVSFDGVNLEWTTLAGNPLSLFIADGAQGTSAAGPFTSQNVSFLIHKNTLFSGRQFRGRMYPPAVPESSVNSVGDLTTAAVTSLQTRATTLTSNLAQVATGLGPLHLLHSPSKLSPPTPEPPPTPIISMTADGMVATQRRRLR